MGIKAYQADLLYIGNGEILSDGIVELNEEGVISHLGLSASSPSIKPLKLKGAISPGFINSHCHLELSHLEGLVDKGKKLTGFIKQLQEIRKASEKEVIAAAAKADLKMKDAGIVAVGDICNDLLTFQLKQKSSIYYHSFIELFGFNPEKAAEIMERGMSLKEKAEEMNLPASLVPHAPYSVSSTLMQALGKTKSNSPLSIHNQETASENELFQKGSGAMAEMLKGFGNDLQAFSPSGKNSLASFLLQLNSVNPLLLVHNTFSSAADIKNAEEIHSNLFWCFCPKANLYIENRLPNFQQFIAAGADCVLGTDSLASNSGLSILEEMKVIQNSNPDIPTEILIKWACQNGAKFLGIDHELGLLQVGTRPGINWLKSLDEKGNLNESSQIETLL